MSPSQLLLFCTKYTIHSLCISALRQFHSLPLPFLKYHRLPSRESVFSPQPCFFINLLSNIRNTCAPPLLCLLNEIFSSHMLNLPSFPICTCILPDFYPTTSVDANYIYPSIYKVLKFHNTPMKAILYRNKIALSWQ